MKVEMIAYIGLVVNAVAKYAMDYGIESNYILTTKGRDIMTNYDKELKSLKKQLDKIESELSVHFTSLEETQHIIAKLEEKRQILREEIKLLTEEKKSVEIMKHITQDKAQDKQDEKQKEPICELKCPYSENPSKCSKEYKERCPFIKTKNIVKFIVIDSHLCAKLERTHLCEKNSSQ